MIEPQMNELPVSVISPTYNRAKRIVRSLRSVLTALATEDEVIVVGDESAINIRSRRPRADSVCLTPIYQ
jgi:Glycosyl transferase family 2